MLKERRVHLAETEQRQKWVRRGFFYFMYITFCTLSFKQRFCLGFDFQTLISLGIE